MGQKLKNLEFQKLFQEYTFLTIDEEYKKEFIAENNTIFIDAIKKLISEEPNLKELIHPKTETNNEINEEPIEENENSEDRLLLNSTDYEFNILNWFINSDKNSGLIIYSDTFNENFIDDELLKNKRKKDVDVKTKEKIKNIFRSIAKKTHPDKAGNNEYSDLYIKAKEASEDFDLYELYSICAKIGITYNIEDTEKEELELKIKDKKDEISKLETAFVWIWMNTPEEDDKKQILRVFLIQHGIRFKSFF